MKCSEFLALLDDLIDDSLTPEVRADFEQHLRGCGHCEVILNTTRKTIEIYRSHEIYDIARRPSRTPPRRHHGPLQKRLLGKADGMVPNAPSFNSGTQQTLSNLPLTSP